MPECVSRVTDSTCHPRLQCLMYGSCLYRSVLHLVHRMNALWGSCSGCRGRCSHQTVGDFSSRRCLRKEKCHIWRSRLSVRRETFFRFMKFSRGVQSCGANVCIVQFYW